MHILHNLPLDDADLKTALENLNALVQKDNDVSHYVLQWIVNNSQKKDLKTLVKYIERQTM